MQVNEKEYQLWSQFVEKKNDFIGGILESPARHSNNTITTIITDITLSKSCYDSYIFTIEGRGFSSFLNTAQGKIVNKEPGWTIFYDGQGGECKIKKPHQQTINKK